MSRARTTDVSLTSRFVSRGGAGHDVARRPEHVHPGCPQAEGITLAEGDPVDAQAPRGEAQRDDPWTVAGHA